MAALDFPNSPTLNQTFTSGPKTWQWDGTSWNVVSTNFVLVAGSNQQVQFNDNGILGAHSGFLYNKSNSTATLGNLTLSAITAASVGTGAFVVSDSGTLKTRTAAQLLSEIAAEPTITAGTTSQYWRGDKSWQTLNLQNVTAIGATTNQPITLTNTAGSYSVQISVDSNGNIVFSSGANQNFHFSGDVIAFSSLTPPVSTWWTSMPYASATVVGGIKVGSGLAIDGSGVLSVTGVGVGSVTSVGLSLPSIFTVTNSPVTSSGTITAVLATQTANTVFAGPSTGAAAAPTFRTLVAADIPALSYEPPITAGTTSQYWRGDKSWQTLNTTAVTEGTNLYYTDSRARSSISLTTTGSSGASTYSSSTGVLNVPTYTLSGLGGEPAITAGTTAQYWRGDKSWQTLNTAAVPESGNLYYTDARARASISVTTTGSSGAATYSNSTGVLNIPTVTLSGLNATLQAVTTLGNTTNTGIVLTNTAATKQVTVSVDTNGNIIFNAGTDQNFHFSGDVIAFSSLTPPAANWWTSMPYATTTTVGGVKVDGTTITINATTGVISSIATGGTSLNGTGFVRMSGTTASYITGTSSQFIKADGSLDSSTYITANQSITWTASGDISGSASGTTSISPSLTVTGLRGVALPSLGASAGFLRYTGTGTNTWVFDTNTYITGNQSITISGDASGGGTTAIAVTNTGLRNVALPALGASAGFLRYTGTGINTWVFDTNTYLTTAVTSVSGTGTVSGLTLSGTVTTTGNITLGGTLSVTASNFASQTANTVLAAPNGTAGTPTFRTLVAADIPTLNQNTTGSAGSVANSLTLRGDSGTTEGTDLFTFNGAAAKSINFAAGNLITITKVSGTWTFATSATANTGTVTSVAALTLGTSGTDLSSSVATGTTTPVITLNVPTASATNRGALSSTDWSTFNGKQAQLNGTGFVKASGTTISYDNNTYITSSGSITGSAGSVANSLTLRADSGTTEGTDIFTFNGSAAKSINFVAGSNISITKVSGNWTFAASQPTVNNGTLTLNVSGSGLSGSQTFTANQSTAATFTVTSNATTAATANTIAYRDSNGDLSTRYFFGSYINTSDNLEAGITRFVIKNGDDYHRSVTTTTAADVIRGVASGSWGISISGNASTATSATTATNTYRVIFDDGPRDLTNRLPNTFTRTVVYDFVTSGTVGGTGNYAGVMTFSPWTGTTASTGDSSYQLAFMNETSINGAGLPGLRLRKGIDTTWGSWYTILTAGNYNSYSPTLTGGGASGTWSISVSGNSATTSQTNFSSLTVNSNTVLHANNYNTYAPSLSGTGAYGSWGISITGSASSAGSVPASGITGQTGMWTSANRPGAYRLYRNDSDDSYNIQTTWSADRSGYWSLRGYLNDSYHAACFVAYSGYADSAGSASTASSATTASSVTNSVTFTTTGGAAAGTTYNGSAARTISWSTVGAVPQARVVSSVSPASLTPDPGSGDLYVITNLSNALTINAPGGSPYHGQKLIIRIYAQAAYTLTWTTGSAGAFRASSDLTLPGTTISARTAYFGFIYNSDASRWDLIAKLENFV